MNFIGELAALGTALAFAINSGLFTSAGRRVGSMVVNRVRLIFAAGFVTLAHWLVVGTLGPWEAEPERWLWLGLSGLAGFVWGDIFLFQAFVWVGARLSMLMMSLAPVIAALVAWVFLGEALTSWQVLGMGLTLGGVAWVIWEGNHRQKVNNKNYGRGILFGLAGATGQALGVVLAKNGMAGDFSPLSGNFMRLMTALVVMWADALVRGEARSTLRGLVGESKALGAIGGGAFIGPFLGVSLSLFALQHAPVGVVSTLTALSPIFLLPIGHFYFKERFGWGAVAGTVMAMTGVGVLFLV